MPDPTDLPPAVESRIDLIKDRLSEIVRGASSWQEVATEVQLELEQAVIGAAQAGEDQGDPEPERRPIDLGAVVAYNVRALRGEADWSQAALAEAMTRVGFDWKRITVAEVESARRKVQLDEMLAIAALYGVPLVELLLPDDQQPVAWVDGHALPAHTVVELVIGYGGEVGDGGPGWLPAVLASGGQTGRPADDYWRSSSVRHGLRRRRRSADR